MRRAWQAGWLAVIAASWACSSAMEPTPIEGCQSDADCSEDQVCGPTGFCSDQVFPLAYIAFDVQESAGSQTQYRAELFGCDQEVEDRRPDGLNVVQDVVSQTLELSVVRRDAANLEFMSVPLEATFELSQASRLSRPLFRRTVAHPPSESETTSVEVRWPRYHPQNPQNSPHYANGGFILWTITPRPIEGEPDRAPMYAMLVPPVADEALVCEAGDEPCGPGLECVRWNGADVCRPLRNPKTAYLNVGYQEVCNRQLRGQAVMITSELERGDPIAATSVSVRYGPTFEGDPFGVPGLEDAPLADRSPRCSTDADCAEGQFCEPGSRQCFLNLVGRLANAVDATTDDSGSFSTPVYTYCEGQTTNPIRRTYAVNVSDRDTERIAERVVPSINYDAEAVFSPPPNAEDKPAGQIDGVLCVPDWGPPQSLQVTLHGEPITLLSDGSADQEYTCCDIGCLPREESETTTGVSETSCTGRTSTDPTVLRLEAPVTLSPAAIAGWIEAGCTLPSIADDNTIGALARIARCTDDTGACEVQGLAAGPDGGARRYRLRLEAPEGSLFRSMDVPVDIEARDDGPLEIELLPRVLVRGRVMLPDDLCPAAADGGDCGSANAWVMAERLRWPEDDDRRPPGPYFQQVQTFVDPVRQTKGHYVLPLDPGVWIVTALPATASLGSPARYEILDLREAPATTEQDFLLDEGSLVTLKLERFDRRATVATIDSGSWRNILQHEGRFIDLSDARQCWGDEGQACRIRRLFPLGPIPASQAGQIRFSARLAPGVPPQASGDCFPR